MVLAHIVSSSALKLAFSSFVAKKLECNGCILNLTVIFFIFGGINIDMFKEVCYNT